MMVCSSSLLSSSTLPHLIPTTYKPPSAAGNGERNLQLCGRKTNRRGISVVTRAAGPSSTSYKFAFVFPLSLLAITIFSSIRISDKLDEKFLQDLAINEAILEAEDDEDEIPISPEKEPTPARTRNRPKREVEPSSM